MQKIGIDGCFLMRFLRQIGALMIKKLIYFGRDKKYVFQEIVIPCMIMLFAFAVLV